MLSEKKNNWLVLMLSLLVTASVTAAPTVRDGRVSRDTRALPVSRDADEQPLHGFSGFADCGDTSLAGVAAELLSPPAGLSDSVASLPLDAKPLPAAPAAILMVLTGFACVSLVKDRRVWLAALVSLASLGQAGLSAVPQLVSQLRSREQIESGCPLNIACTGMLDELGRLRSDIEGTRYMGLLRHLAGMPRRPGQPQKYSILRASSQLNSSALRGHAVRAHQRRANRELESTAPEPLPCLIQAFNDSVRDIEQYACFSPAFVFGNLARSPPLRPCDFRPRSMRRVACAQGPSGLQASQYSKHTVLNNAIEGE